MTRAPLAAQWETAVIEPVLTRLGLHSEAAVNLLLGTLAAESHFSWLTQHPAGPALGFYQIEPATALDVVNRLPVRFRAAVYSLRGYHSLEEGLVWNLAYQTAIARLKYYLRPEPLPAADDLEGLGWYWLKWYNAGGKGSIDRWWAAWTKYVAG